MPFPPLPKEDLEHVFAHTRPLWEQLRGGRIFVTGATGFFGIWLLESFAYANEELGLGAELVGLTRNPGTFHSKAPHLANHPSIRLLQGDVLNFDFPEGSFTHVIHSIVPDPGMPLPEMENWFQQGTQRLLDLAFRSKSQSFLLCSTGAVYQPQGRLLREDDPLIDPDALLSYGRIRRQVEDQCLEGCERHGIALKIARGFAFAGPHLPLDANFAIGNFIRDAMQGEPIKVKDGTPYRSYLYAADLAIWLWTILFKGEAGRPYNVGSDQEITIADLAHSVATTLGGHVAPPPPSTLNVNSPSRYVPDVSRIQKELGLAPAIKLSDALQRTALWMRQ